MEFILPNLYLVGKSKGQNKKKALKSIDDYISNDYNNQSKLI